MWGVDFDHADLGEAKLKFCHISVPSNLNWRRLKSAVDWEHAFYDEDDLKWLGLPSTHNENVAREQKRESAGGPKKLPCP